MENYLIKNAKLVTSEYIDILVENNIIKKIAPSIPISNSTKVIDCKEQYISAGWIDMHTHCFNKFKIYGDQPDSIGYPHGVCTVIDAGTAGSDTIDEFYQQSLNAKTRVYAWLNISSTGIYAQNELSNLIHLDEKKIINSCQRYPDFIIGLKARMSKSVLGDSGNQPLIFANEIKKKLHMPLMVHIGTAPSLLADVIKMLEKNDIITHIFNPKDNGILNQGSIKSCVYKAIEKGLCFDLGHGTDSFSFAVAKKAFDKGMLVDTISTDIYFRNRENGPVFNLPTTMNKMLAIGYSLEQVIDCVTKNPAKLLGLNLLGKIAVGKVADFTIFKLIHKDIKLIDSTGQTIESSQCIIPTRVIVKGQMFDLEENVL